MYCVGIPGVTKSSIIKSKILRCFPYFLEVKMLTIVICMALCITL